MRTLILLGVAAGSLWWADSASSATLPGYAPQSSADALVRLGHGKPKDGARLDYGAPYSGDDRVYTGYPDRIPAEGDYRRVEDGYGGWSDSYEGSYEGSYGTDYDAPPPGYAPGGYPPEYAPRYNDDAELARLCGNRRTVGGAVLGGVVGGVAGNRIAGRGNRTAGTLIGAGVGAIAGGAIGNSADQRRCDEYWARSSSQSNGYYPPQAGYPPRGPYPLPPRGHGDYPVTYYPQHGGVQTHVQHAYPQSQYPQGWYSPGMIVTTIVTQGAAVQQQVIEETTTVTYENVYAPARKRHVPKKRHYKPRPKPRCGC